MKVTLFLPYYDYNDGNFDVSNDYYSEDEYSNAMSKNFNESKDIVYNSVLAAKNGTGSLVQGSDGHTYKFGQKTSQSEDKVAFSKCEGILSDISGEEDTVDSIISKFASQKQFLEIKQKYPNQK